MLAKGTTDEGGEILKSWMTEGELKAMRLEKDANGNFIDRTVKNRCAAGLIAATNRQLSDMAKPMLSRMMTVCKHSGSRPNDDPQDRLWARTEQMSANKSLHCTFRKNLEFIVAVLNQCGETEGMDEGSAWPPMDMSVWNILIQQLITRSGAAVGTRLQASMNQIAKAKVYEQMAIVCLYSGAFAESWDGKWQGQENTTWVDVALSQNYCSEEIATWVIGLFAKCFEPDKLTTIVFRTLAEMGHYKGGGKYGSRGSTGQRFHVYDSVLLECDIDKAARSILTRVLQKKTGMKVELETIKDKLQHIQGSEMDAVSRHGNTLGDAIRVEKLQCKRTQSGEAYMLVAEAFLDDVFRGKTSVFEEMRLILSYKRPHAVKYLWPEGLNGGQCDKTRFEHMTRVGAAQGICRTMYIKPGDRQLVVLHPDEHGAMNRTLLAEGTLDHYARTMMHQRYPHIYHTFGAHNNSMSVAVDSGVHYPTSFLEQTKKKFERALMTTDDLKTAGHVVGKKRKLTT
jgi:hypothetical protein